MAKLTIIIIISYIIGLTSGHFWAYNQNQDISWVKANAPAIIKLIENADKRYKTCIEAGVAMRNGNICMTCHKEVIK